MLLMPKAKKTKKTVQSDEGTLVVYGLILAIIEGMDNAGRFNFYATEELVDIVTKIIDTNRVPKDSVVVAVHIAIDAALHSGVVRTSSDGRLILTPDGIMTAISFKRDKGE